MLPLELFICSFSKYFVLLVNFYELFCPEIIQIQKWVVSSIIRLIHLQILKDIIELQAFRASSTRPNVSNFLDKKIAELQKEYRDGSTIVIGFCCCLGSIRKVCTFIMVYYFGSNHLDK
uniref:Gustatory receptor n=1 Tax=Heterorhabditis bacteriophora TaxID=37862 RepID=A0A1I7WR09_HETBA